MNTKAFISMVIAFLIAMTIIANMLVPRKELGGKTELIWTTDPNPQRDPQVDAFNRLYPKYHLRIDPDNADVMKVVVQSSAGMGPDLIDHVNDNTFQTYLDAGILLDVTEKAREMGFSPDTLHEAVRPFVMMKVPDEEGNLKERQFVYPCNVYHTFIIFNKNIFDKYGVEYPSEDLTWEQYIEIAKKVTIYENSNSKIPTIFGTAGSEMTIILWSHGGRLINDDGTRSMLDSEEAVNAFIFKHSLLYKHKIEPTPTEMAAITSQGGWGGHMSWFGEGKVAIMWGARWMLIQFRRFVENQKTIRDNWIKANPDKSLEEAPQVLRMGAVLVPRFENTKRITAFGARCTGINKMSKNLDGAYCFLQFLASEEYSRTINEGADSKPGNMKYNKLELFLHSDYPEEKEIHEMSIKSVPYGYMTPRSQFISSATIQRIFWSAYDNVITKENITREEVKRILKSASDEINLEIARNIKRNRKLRVIYDKMLKNGAEPIVMNLEQVR